MNDALFVSYSYTFKRHTTDGQNGQNKLLSKRPKKRKEKFSQTKLRAGRQKKSCQVSFMIIISATAFRMFQLLLSFLFYPPPHCFDSKSILKLESTCLGQSFSIPTFVLMLKIKKK